jgi:hypothetical protein
LANIKQGCHACQHAGPQEGQLLSQGPLFKEGSTTILALWILYHQVADTTGANSGFPGLVFLYTTRSGGKRNADTFKY